MVDTASLDRLALELEHSQVQDMLQTSSTLEAISTNTYTTCLLQLH